MTAKTALSPGEWKVVLEGPPTAGMIVIPAARDGMLPGIAQVERFWRQLGVKPAGQQPLTPVSPGVPAPLSQPFPFGHPSLPSPRTWLRMTRHRGYSNCASSHSCTTRACFPTRSMRQPSDASWNRRSSLSRRGRRHHRRLGRRSADASGVERGKVPCGAQANDSASRSGYGPPVREPVHTYSRRRIQARVTQPHTGGR
jgi:hypothetical protein